MTRDPLLEGVPSAVQQPRGAQHRPHQSPTVLTQRDICQRLGISDETWRRWRTSGRAPAPLPNFPPRRPRWRTQDIEDIEHGRVVVGPTTRRYFTAHRQRRGA